MQQQINENDSMDGDVIAESDKIMLKSNELVLEIE